MQPNGFGGQFFPPNGLGGGFNGMPGPAMPTMPNPMAIQAMIQQTMMFLSNPNLAGPMRMQLQMQLQQLQMMMASMMGGGGGMGGGVAGFGRGAPAAAGVPQMPMMHPQQAQHGVPGNDIMKTFGLGHRARVGGGGGHSPGPQIGNRAAAVKRERPADMVELGEQQQEAKAPKRE
jgi:hypothetical protein